MDVPDGVHPSLPQSAVEPCSGLEQAALGGEQRIKRKDGRIFVVRPEIGKDSPPDVEGISLTSATDEVVAIIRKGREGRI